MSTTNSTPSIPLWRRLPRLTACLVIALVLLAVISIVSPQQLPVVLYKLSIISLAAAAGYWIDRSLFPYARPDGYLQREWRCGPCAGQHRTDYPISDGYEPAFLIATIRRAVIVVGAILAAALGL